MYVINLLQGDDLIQSYRSFQTMHKTLVLAADAVKGIPQAECCIRREGKLAGFISTNFRGELEECEIWSPISGLVTPINPQWDAFNRTK